MSKYIRANQDVDTSMLALEMMWRGINDEEIKDQVGVSAPESFLEVIKGRTINYMAEEDSAKLFIEKASQFVLNNKRFKDLIEKSNANSYKLLEFSMNIWPNIDQLNDQERLEVLKQIRELEIESGKLGFTIAFSDYYGTVTNRLIEIIQKRAKLNHPIHIYSSVLGTPKELSLTWQAYEDIRSSKENDEILLNKYFWLDQGYIGRGLNIEQLAEIRSGGSCGKTVLVSELEKELDLNKEEGEFFEIARQIVQAKTLRADLRQTAYTVMNRIVDIISKERNIESRHIETLYSKEFIDILSDKIVFPKETVELRYDHSVYIPDGIGEYKILVGEDAVSFVRDHSKTETLTGEIKGMVAHPGIVSGRVKLVFGPQHNAKVEKGDILVSVVTSPQLLPAMVKAGAFVTDVGGITSHAAIVARELKKPCIVGTKISTQVLKDGDMVEVDANKGTVRKIERVE